MFKKKMFFLMMGLVFSGILSAQSGREIMQKVIDVQKTGSSAVEIEMILMGQNGEESRRRLQTLMTSDSGSTKTITIFMEPARVKNTRFLTISHETRNDDQWIYLPALKKVKRIASGEQDGSFMGSDFTYADMSTNTDSLDHSTQTFLCEEVLDGKNCFVVESVSGPDSDSAYGKTISWVDRESWLTVEVEFYGKRESSVPQKRLKCEDIKKLQGHWYAQRITMETLATHHQTILEIRQVKYDIDFNPGYFTTGFLETGRVQ